MSRQRPGVLFLAAATAGVLAACTTTVDVQVRPSNCINPPLGDCSGGNNESRILDVRLYQLKETVDPCSLDLEQFAQGKDLEALKSVLAETATKEPRWWGFKVTAGEPKSLGSWEIGKDTRYVLAVALGRGRGKNSGRLIPIERLQGDWKFPTLFFHGYDICLNHSCTDVTTEVQCNR